MVLKDLNLLAGTGNDGNEDIDCSAYDSFRVQCWFLSGVAPQTA
jgi:hypothetical protein